MISSSPAGKVLRFLLLLLLVPVSGSAQQGTREVMADAMSRMMEAMGLFDSASAQYDAGSSGRGRERSAPWGSPVRDWSRASAMRELMRQYAGQAPSSGKGHSPWPIAWKPSRLEGIWEGRGGELLIVQGDRFRIYSPEIRRKDGLMQIRGNRLALYDPLDQNAQAFEFAESQGRLIIRDLAGQLYLYRRLKLDGS